MSEDSFEEKLTKELKTLQPNKKLKKYQKQVSRMRNHFYDRTEKLFHMQLLLEQLIQKFDYLNQKVDEKVDRLIDLERQLDEEDLQFPHFAGEFSFTNYGADISSISLRDTEENVEIREVYNVEAKLTSVKTITIPYVSNPQSTGIELS